MGDVVQICQRNYDLRKWEDEMVAAEAKKREQKRKQMQEQKRREERKQMLRVASMVCSTVMGSGATLLGVGMACGDMGVVAIGLSLTIGAVFGGVLTESLLEDER